MECFHNGKIKKRKSEEVSHAWKANDDVYGGGGECAARLQRLHAEACRGAAAFRASMHAPRTQSYVCKCPFGMSKQSQTDI